MKEVNYYECEFCGERFDYEHECWEHEQEHIFSEVANSLFFFDVNKKLINMGETWSWFDKVFYIVIRTEKAYNVLYEYCESQGLDVMDAFDSWPNHTGVIYYDETFGVWRHVDKERQQLENLNLEFSKYWN